MFGQHPQVGISSFPIDQSLHQNLATDMDVNSHLGLPPDVPLEDATLMASFGADTTIESPLDSMQSKSLQKSDDVSSLGLKTPEEEFHSVGFKNDVTDAFVAALVRKRAVLKDNKQYFG